MVCRGGEQIKHAAVSFRQKNSDLTVETVLQVKHQGQIRPLLFNSQTV